MVYLQRQILNRLSKNDHRNTLMVMMRRRLVSSVSSSTCSSSSSSSILLLNHPLSFMNNNMNNNDNHSNRSYSSNNTSNTPATTNENNQLTIPINFDIASTISGNESQILTVQLYPNQILRAESGAMMYMTSGIEMNTTMGGGSGNNNNNNNSSNALSAGFKRLLTGQNLFISDYTYHGVEGTYGTVCLGTDFPSKIMRLNVTEYGGKVICQKGALLCSSHTIDIEMEFTKKFSTGFFGGEGFVLQGLVGTGDVFVKAGG